MPSHPGERTVQNYPAPVPRYGQIKIVIRVIGVFKAVNGNIRFLVKLLGNPPGETVQLYAVEFRIRHGLRQEAKEVADAHRRLQHGPRLVVHIFHRLINGLNDGGAGIGRSFSR